MFRRKCRLSCNQARSIGRSCMPPMNRALLAKRIFNRLSIKRARLLVALTIRLIRQQAIEAVKAEHQALGMDLGAIQLRYLAWLGAQMLAVAALMMAASISVGFVASRTAAKIARNLRERLFEKVVSFSDAEVQSFSAASLITRGTNDIQQIQMVLVMFLRMVLYAPILAIGGIIMVSQTNLAMSWIICAGNRHYWYSNCPFNGVSTS